jgi:hypothetical protein
MKHRGDTIGNRLPVAVDKGDINREIDTGARHHLALEGVAVHIHDARQRDQAALSTRMTEAGFRKDISAIFPSAIWMKASAISLPSST